MPNEKLKIIENPFRYWGDSLRLVLVPSINPDVTILHVQKADKEGTCRIEGLTFADVEQAKAAKHVIVTCEELIDSKDLHRDSDINSLPPFCVDAVVVVPYGSYPTACYRYYDYDPEFLKKYANFASDDQQYREYLNTYIYGTEDHSEFLKINGNKQLKMIQADMRTGYATGLVRN